MPEITSSSLTPGATYLIRFWEFGGTTGGTFDICVSALAPPAGNTTCTVQTEYYVYCSNTDLFRITHQFYSEYRWNTGKFG
jgi:hypothetical protein